MALARRLRALLLLLALWVAATHATTTATTSNATATSNLTNGTHALEIQLTWREASLLDVSLAERSLREGARELQSLSAVPSAMNGSNVTATKAATAFAVSDVRVTDVHAVAGRDANLTLALSALSASAWNDDEMLSTFAVSIRVSFDADNSTNTIIGTLAAMWNSSQIVSVLADRLARDVTAAVAAARDGDGLNTDVDMDPSSTGTATPTGSSSSSSSSVQGSSTTDPVLVDATPLHRLLRRFTPDKVDAAIIAPTSSAANSTNSTADVVTLTLTLRNIVDPAELPRSVLWQAQAGLARFLAPVLGATVFLNDTSNVTKVEPLGGAQVSSRSVLLVKQQFTLLLPQAKASTLPIRSSFIDEDELLMTTRVLNLTRSTDRRALANLIQFGDPTRPIDDATSAGSRSSLFLDYIFPRKALSEVLASDAVARAPSFHRALFPFVFAGISVDDPRLASIEEAEAAALSSANTSATTIPAVNNVELRARRVQKFRFDPDAYYALLPSNVSYPPVASGSNASSEGNTTSTTTAATTINSTCPFAYCTSIYWTNAVGRGFWLESVESADQFAWTLFPSERFCSPTSSSSSLEADASADMDEEAQLASLARLIPAPLVEPEAAKTPVWTLGALSGLRTSRLDLALHLRSEDGATRLTVEVATDIQSPLDASATVTSIARLSNVSSAPSIYETTSNLIVSARSRFRYADGSSSTGSGADGREMLLFLEIREGEVTRKDTTQPCAHCQALFDWCANDQTCSTLRNCVGTSANLDVVAQNMLQVTTMSTAVNRSADVWPSLMQCLLPALNSSTSTDAALLLASAVRCQMQRLCPFRAVAAAYNSTSNSTSISEEDDFSDERILLWESGVARHQIALTTPAVSAIDSALGTATFPSVNVSVRLAGQTLCFLSLAANVTGEWIEDAIARDCHYAKYLGRILPTVTSSTSTTASTTSTTIDLGYKYLVGPMPTLQVEDIGTSALATVTISAVTMPQVFLRAETKAYTSGGNLLPPPPINVAVPPSECTKCSRLVLDVCLRDSACIAFTDCILRSSAPGDASTAPTTMPAADAGVSMADAVFAMFKRQQEGENTSLLSAINACHTSDMSTHTSWLKLVRASACFSRAQCPISLAILLPSPANAVTVGLWRLSPAFRRQKLYYYFDSTAAASSASASSLRIPLQLVSDGAVVKSTSSSVDPLALQANLRRLLKFEDIYVSLLVGSADSSDTTSERVWEISYAHWVGSLPKVVAAELAPTWTLMTMSAIDESEVEDALVEMISAANSTSGASGTTSEVTIG